MLKDKLLERGEPALREVESPHFVPPPPHRPSREIEARTPLPLDSPAAEQPRLPARAEEKQPEASGKRRRNGLVRRRPVVLAIGAMLLAAAVGGGDLYLDNAGHFRSTDDAFIAARQSALAPKVSGYITAVPVTDNQHVAAGDVIARLDDRDYRVALAQAQGQVSAAQASIENIDAQISVQQAQINTNQAQVTQAQAALVFAQQQAARYVDLARKGAGTVQNAQQYTSQLSSRRRSRVRKPPSKWRSGRS